MSGYFELAGPERVSVGTVGPVGQRVFLLQAREGATLVTLKLEKQQVGALAQHLARLLEDVPRPSELPEDDALALEEPLDPAFVVGTLAVAYDAIGDRVIVLAEERVEEDADGEEARFALTREQAAALAIQGTRLVEAGRPPCPLCGFPLDPARPRMPQDERTPGPPHLSPRASRELLEEGEIEVLGRMPWSSNVTLLVTLRRGDEEAKAVYKPGSGERELWDFPDGLYRREVAAYELSEALGLDVVPCTVLRHDAPYGEGSLQAFVDADFEQHYFSLLEHDRHREQLRRIAGYDLLANNADRKGGHLLIDADEHIYGIDNGLCFHPHPKLRTVMWDFAGERVPREIIEGAHCLLEALPDRLTSLLSPVEQVALTNRCSGVLADSCFPGPRGDRHEYPWPLV